MLARPNDNLAAYMRMVAAGKADLVVASETRTQQEEMGVVRGLWQKMGYDHVGTCGKVGDAGSTVWGVSVMWNVQRLRLVNSRVVVPARVVRAEFEIVGDVDKQRMVVYLSLIHISEPTRPERISYAVFCLKKKNKLSFI